jgi:hypothetical protein
VGAFDDESAEAPSVSWGERAAEVEDEVGGTDRVSRLRGVVGELAGGRGARALRPEADQDDVLEMTFKKAGEGEAIAGFGAKTRGDGGRGDPVAEALGDRRGLHEPEDERLGGSGSGFLSGPVGLQHGNQEGA